MKFSLAGKGKKSKGIKTRGKTESSQNGGKEKKDLSKIKCFDCHEFGHYATNCPNKIYNKKDETTIGGKTLFSHLALDFSLLACMERSI